MAAMLSELPARQSFLDVPFGTGRFADLYNRRQDQVIGVDISMDMLHSALRLSAVAELGPGLIRGDAERLPFRDHAVDYVVCTRFFNWLPAEVWPTVLGEFARVAVRGILLQLRVRDEPSPGEFASRLLQEIARDPVGGMSARARDLARHVARRGRGALGTLISTPTRGSRMSPHIGGYSVPDDSEFRGLLDSAGLVVHQTTPVHANFSFREHAVFEMRLYHLSGAC